MKTTADLIKEVGREVVMLLIEKNKNYGDTANHPPQIFSKLSRIKKLGFEDPMKSEDTLKDLIGYLILLKVQILKEDEVIKDKLIKSKREKLKEFK
jgi:hypothetical protein